MDNCPDAPLDEPELTPHQKELNRLTHKQANAQKEVDAIVADRDYILPVLEGSDYIKPDVLAAIKQNYANHFEDAHGELIMVERKMHDLLYGYKNDA